MSRVGLSPYAKKSINKLNDENCYLDLLTISHADLPSDIRIVNNNENITSNGLLYQGFNFKAVLPVDNTEQEPNVTLEVGNVDRQIVDSLLSISSPATVKLQCVLSENRDSVEIEILDLKLRVANYDQFVVSGTLVMEDVLSQSFPSQSYTPTQFKSII